MFGEFHIKMLRALSERQLTTSELKQLYTSNGDGQRFNTLIRYGLAEWLRRSENGNAYAVRITDAGRAELEQTQ